MNSANYNFDPSNPSVRATFNFDPETGAIIPKPAVPRNLMDDEELAARLIADAEQINNFPDTAMFFPVDESDYQN